MVLFLKLETRPLIQYNTLTHQKYTEWLRGSHSCGSHIHKVSRKFNPKTTLVLNVSLIRGQVVKYSTSTSHFTLFLSPTATFLLCEECLKKVWLRWAAAANSFPSWRSVRRRSSSAPRFLCSGGQFQNCTRSGMAALKSVILLSRLCRWQTFCSSVRSSESTFICSFLRLAW